VFFIAATAFCTPPHYKSFHRKQEVSHAYDEADLLRIWVVYVGQGDGILIQLPTKYNYDPDPDDGIDDKSERVDVLIDGGSFRSSNAELMMGFLESMYGLDSIRIETAVITHHDKDHIIGLTRILENDSIAIEAIYHNGLASYRYAGRIKSAVDGAAHSVVDKRGQEVKRVMATVAAGSDAIGPALVIDDKEELQEAFDDGLLHGIYADLAEAVLVKEMPGRVGRFDRIWADESVVAGFDGIALDVIWPQKTLRAYKSRNWGKTINGNSVTFVLEYGAFQMLFTGDHNKASEPVLLAALKDGGDLDRIVCDVLKAPHHGSKHSVEDFFRPTGSPAVVTVASMGPKGFGRSWKHPSAEAIGWAGGAHRFYSTHIHERRFKWSEMGSVEAKNEMLERKHVLIETDGVMFRVVELDAEEFDGGAVPSVSEVRRSNGTRWIAAKPE
jgi:beta-lactamase superfamily II metal-dependent hydrolase